MTIYPKISIRRIFRRQRFILIYNLKSDFIVIIPTFEKIKR